LVVSFWVVGVEEVKRVVLLFSVVVEGAALEVGVLVEGWGVEVG
jgi:hypothetical protein